MRWFKKRKKKIYHIMLQYTKTDKAEAEVLTNWLKGRAAF